MCVGTVTKWSELSGRESERGWGNEAYQQQRVNRELWRDYMNNIRICRCTTDKYVCCMYCTVHICEMFHLFIKIKMKHIVIANVNGISNEPKYKSISILSVCINIFFFFVSFSLPLLLNLLLLLLVLLFLFGG